MKSSIHKQLLSAALIVCFVTSSFAALSVPRKVEAAGDACKGGMVVAVAQLAWATIKGTVSAQTGTEGPTQRFLGNYKDAGAFINDCILKPLAQMMVVALVRNIGASIVNWVNTGFEGKPSFVTDFEGTLLDAADQAAGNFIEGQSDLGFLCSPFSFQIRIALALKYSRPFNEQVRCTLSEIGDNISNFADNNGGRGWDNWLKITTEPQNNIYGAYLIADSELARRMANAVDVKEKRISLGQGFLDFETCDEEESDAEYNGRIASIEEYGSTYVGEKIQVTKSVFDANNVGASPTVSTEFVDSSSKKKICKQKSVKTPGRVIADQLQNEFATGPIQRAVAQEIDQVIAATLNQLAQKAIQGASGLLGLSQRKQSNSSSYVDRYRAQYYGQGTTATIDTSTGAQSELDRYTVGSYDDALALRDDPTNADVRSIDQFTDSAAGAQIQAQQSQISTTATVYAGETPDKNVALGKSAAQSSTLNPAGNGNDGVRQTSQYIKGAETSSSEPGGWWEVDLGGNKDIKQVNIYQNPSSSAPDGGLGTFVVQVRDDAGSSTEYPGSSFTEVSGYLSGNIGRMGRYVRITRLASETTCEDDYYGNTYFSSSPCIDQPHLAFAELEVIEKPEQPTEATATSTTSTGSQTQQTTQTDTSTATSTLSWNQAVISAGTTNPLNQQIALKTVKSVNELTVEIGLYEVNQYGSTGRSVPFMNMFDNFDILRGASDGAVVGSQSFLRTSDSALRTLISINQGASYTFTIKGQRRAGVTRGNYSFITQVSDSTGKVLEDKTQRINFVVE